MVAKKNAKTHCINGHKFTAKTTYVSPKGNRACRECKRIAIQRYRADI